jgi:cytochrome P450
MITMDPPQHTTQRTLVRRAFTSRAVKRLEVHIRDIARAVLDDVPTAQPIDFIDAVAARVPAIVIAELLGVPVEDRDKFVKWTNASIGMADPEYADDQVSAVV